MFMRRLLSIVLTAVMLAVFDVSGARAEGLAIATAYPADNFHTRNIQTFADEVAAATHGAVQFEVHANATLFKAPEIFPAVAAGRAVGGEVIMASVSNVAPVFGVDSVPFLVRGIEDARRLWTLSRDEVAKSLTANGLHLLYAVPWPAQNLYSDRPITRTADLQGLHLRTYNPGSQRFAELVGAKPTTIQVVDLERAIADGRVDLMLTSSWTGVQSKAWTRLRYYYVVNAWIPKNMVFVNLAWWNRQTAAVQADITRLAAKAEARGWAMSQDNTREFDALLAQNKVQILAPSVFLDDDFKRYGEILTREWLKTAGNSGVDILLKYEVGDLANPAPAKS